MDKILIAGGSGLIGQHLTKILIANGFDVAILSRTENLNKPVKAYYWSPLKGEINLNAFNSVSCIINLAGENIGAKRWTKTQKQKIISSRIESTNLLYQTVVKHKININTYISASAVGYYGAITSEKIFKEDDPPFNDFLGNVCKQWEEAANQFNKINVRTIKLRTGVVFSNKGGALEKLIKPIKYYLGAPLGSGKQYVPWIHIDDLCQMYLYVLKNNLLAGAYNAVAPEHITNKELTYKLAKKLNKPIILPSVPSFVLKLILGEMSKMVLNGSRVSCEKMISTGFKYKYNTLIKALNQLL